MAYSKEIAMTDTTYGAKIQKDAKTYAIQTRIPSGIVSPQDLERIAGVARKYKIPLIKITSGQRFLLVGVEETDIAAVRAELGDLGTGSISPGVRYVQSCPGNAYCKNGTQDSRDLAREISDEYNGKEFPAKIKIGISGCPRCCGESKVRDIGIMGTSKGWTIFFGGHSGFKVRTGELVATNLTTDEARELVRSLLTYYGAHAQPKERTSRFLERVGSGWLSSEVLGIQEKPPATEQ
ncbi:MAG: NAD(P)/FAD-dependent oxidoreductase [Methanoregula sp.]|nr:NAD(P)/FAD-dependent oxidoreductase [Methanoregula sp.]